MEDYKATAEYWRPELNEDPPDMTTLLPRWISTTQPEALYLVVRVTPGRIDLVDEELGWGTQETLEW